MSLSHLLQTSTNKRGVFPFFCFLRLNPHKRLMNQTKITIFLSKDTNVPKYFNISLHLIRVETVFQYQIVGALALFIYKDKDRRAAKCPEGFSQKLFPNDVAPLFFFKKFYFSLPCLLLVSQIFQCLISTVYFYLTVQNN